MIAEGAAAAPKHGATVVLRNMHGRQHLNGMLGVVIPHADGSVKDASTHRRRVKLCGTPFAVKVHPDNIFPASGRSAAQAIQPTPPPRPPSTPRRPVMHSRRRVMAGETYAEIQASLVRRDPRRLRKLGVSMFRDDLSVDEEHPSASNPSTRQVLAHTSREGFDWRDPIQRYTHPSRIHHDKGGFAAAPPASFRWREKAFVSVDGPSVEPMSLPAKLQALLLRTDHEIGDAGMLDHEVLAQDAIEMLASDATKLRSQARQPKPVVRSVQYQLPADVHAPYTGQLPSDATRQLLARKTERGSWASSSPVPEATEVLKQLAEVFPDDWEPGPRERQTMTVVLPPVEEVRADVEGVTAVCSQELEKVGALRRLVEAARAAKLQAEADQGLSDQSDIDDVGASASVVGNYGNDEALARLQLALQRMDSDSPPCAGEPVPRSPRSSPSGMSEMEPIIEEEEGDADHVQRVVAELQRQARGSADVPNESDVLLAAMRPDPELEATLPLSDATRVPEHGLAVVPSQQQDLDALLGDTLVLEAAGGSTLTEDEVLGAALRDPPTALGLLGAQPPPEAIDVKGAVMPARVEPVEQSPALQDPQEWT